MLDAVPVPDPARRGARHKVSADEIRNPNRLDYVPPVRQYREVSPGHVVQVWGEDWEPKGASAAA